MTPASNVSLRSLRFVKFIFSPETASKHLRMALIFFILSSTVSLDIRASSSDCKWLADRSDLPHLEPATEHVTPSNQQHSPQSFTQKGVSELYHLRHVVTLKKPFGDPFIIIKNLAKNSFCLSSLSMSYQTPSFIAANGGNANYSTSGFFHIQLRNVPQPALL